MLVDEYLPVMSVRSMNRLVPTADLATCHPPAAAAPEAAVCAESAPRAAHPSQRRH